MFMLMRVRHAIVCVLMRMFVRVLMLVGVIMLVLAFHPSPQVELARRLDAVFDFSAIVVTRQLGPSIELFYQENWNG